MRECGGALSKDMERNLRKSWRDHLVEEWRADLLQDCRNILLKNVEATMMDEIGAAVMQEVKGELQEEIQSYRHDTDLQLDQRLAAMNMLKAQVVSLADKVEHSQLTEKEVRATVHREIQKHVEPLHNVIHTL